MNRGKPVIQSPEERLAEWKARVRESLEKLNALNEEDGAIDASCVELAALHNAFAHKHTVMRAMRKERIDMERYNRERG